ncbi:hypothetical protein GCM10019996_08170 [Lentilactobacillus parakefiri]
MVATGRPNQSTQSGDPCTSEHFVDVVDKHQDDPNNFDIKVGDATATLNS